MVSYIWPLILFHCDGLTRCLRWRAGSVKISVAFESGALLVLFDSKPILQPNGYPTKRTQFVVYAHWEANVKMVEGLLEDSPANENAVPLYRQLECHSRCNRGYMPGTSTQLSLMRVSYTRVSASAPYSAFPIKIPSMENSHLTHAIRPCELHTGNNSIRTHAHTKYIEWRRTGNTQRLIRAWHLHCSS